MTIPQSEGVDMNIEHLLQSEIASAHRLMHTLDQEYAALAQRDVDLLDTIVPEKRNIVAELEALGRQRDALLAQLNPSTTTAESANPFSDDTRLSDLWDELKSVAQQCQDKNRINGSIVEIGYRQSRQALDILHGVSSSSELYDKSGRTTKPGASHPIIRA